MVYWRDEDIPLTEHGHEYVPATVEDSEAKDAAEVADFALRKTEANRRTHEAKAEAFRDPVQAGLDDLDKGRVTSTVPAEDQPSFINWLSPGCLKARPSCEARASCLGHDPERHRART